MHCSFEDCKFTVQRAKESTGILILILMTSDIYKLLKFILIFIKYINFI